MEIIKQLIPEGNRNHTGRTQIPKYVTIHNTGNYSPSAGARNHAQYLFNGSDGIASWHYSVDSKEIYQSLPDNIQGRHSGGRGNTEGIGIEICVNDRDGFVDACRLAAKLTGMLLDRHGLTIDAVKQHFDWSGKNCPMEIRGGQWGVTWEQFLGWVREDIWTEDVPAVFTRPVLRRAGSGEGVRYMQQRLLYKKQSLPGYGADGRFGGETEAAVRGFQAARGLDTDGVCGPLTWEALEDCK